MLKYRTEEPEALLRLTPPKETAALLVSEPDKTKIFSSLSNLDFSQPISPLFENLSDTRASGQFLAQALYRLSCQSLTQEAELTALAHATLLTEESHSLRLDDAPLYLYISYIS